MSNAKRFYELDVLRGLAALGVVLFHYTTDANGKVLGYNTGYWYNFKAGYYGVELFFMISGFVIFLTLEKINKGREFIISRLARLFPVYWTAVLLTILMTLILTGGKIPFNFTQIAVNFTMLAGFLDIGYLDGVYWTLTHELAFYVIMFSLYKLKLLDKIEWISIIWLIIIFAFSLLNKNQLIYIPGRISIALLLDHGMFFIAGISFYKIYKLGFKIFPLIIIGFSLLTYLIVQNHGHPQIIAFFIFFSLVVSKKLQFISLPPLIFLGTISYSLYLIHDKLGEIVITYLHYKVGMDVNFAMPIAVSVGILVATAMTFLIEKPALVAIKKRYF